MRVLIAYAHPEPASFNAALLSRAKSTLVACGHDVVVRDLYVIGFEPCTTAADFPARTPESALHYDLEQLTAFTAGALSDDIKVELDHLLAADLLILQFPLTWFSMPAILKGWIDRIFVNGAIYGDGRWYDRGALSGKRAMLAITTGCFPSMCGADGINGNLDVTLWPIHNGILRFVGFTVLPPFVAWSVTHKTDADRVRDLDRYGARLQTVETEESLPFHTRGEFGADWRLHAGLDSITVGQTTRDSHALAANPQDFAQPTPSHLR